ncbi:hypothetical protein GCM10007216_33280 [Thalassobacillus devorans]|uniref:Uncharacterized protein n=1 Tax=Thalassobacillus devorans TaxID=279813 RepID=A0ABQ1PMX2_9BACI|nr:hypothetical protein [Thalassobacillus devorans]NIK30288.1 hypothetical protein [Thalassobacillus devorans]GGC99873.1 hypothetical protein GCM10007216_33280 [Thalassobacillus devorans]
MMKKLVGMLLLSLVLMLAAGGNVFAADNGDENMDAALKLADTTNSKIYFLIEKAQETGDALQENYLEDMETIEDEAEAAARTEKYNQNLDLLIAVLDYTTRTLTYTTITAIEKLGVEAEVEWVEVQIADRTVMVDPVRVVGF